MRAAAGVLTVLLVAACSGAGAPPTALPTDRARASFPAGGIADTIEIDAVDRLPLRSAELVAPGGAATPATAIAANPAPSESLFQQSPNGPYAGTAGTAFAVGSIGSNALAPAVVGAAPRTETKLLAVVSTASIALPDPVAYRRDWQKYRIRLRFGDPPGQVETREIAAPEPPPGS